MASFHTPGKSLTLVDMRPKDHEVKGAVQLDPSIHRFIRLDGAQNLLQPNALPPSTYVTFDKLNDNLVEFVARLFVAIGLPQGNGGEYALMFEDGRKFVTEKNKSSVQQGFMLTLSASPENYSHTILAELENIQNDVSQATLATFVRLSADLSFAEAFHSLSGITKVLELVEAGIFESNMGVLSQLLQALQILMDTHGELMPWNEINAKFLERITGHVDGRSKVENNDSLNLALNIILNVLGNCSHLKDAICEGIKFESLIRHLENSDERILLGVLSLMNRLYGLASAEERQAIVKILHGKPFIAAIDSAIQRESQTPDQRIREQFQRLQKIIFEELRNMAMRQPSDKELEYIANMDEFRGGDDDEADDSLADNQLVLINEGAEDEQTLVVAIPSKKAIADHDQFRQLVEKTPPGSLALSALIDYVRPDNVPSERFREIKSNCISLRPRLWPVVTAHLVQSLVSVLRICDSDQPLSNNRKQPLTPTPPDYIKLILKCERPFYNVFGVAMELFQRTWHEMHANVDDLAKVLRVVHEQLERVICTVNPGTLEVLDQTLRREFSYFHMKKLWERERMDEEDLELNTQTIQSLRDYLRPSIERLVLQRKKNVLKKGLNFVKLNQGGVGKGHQDIQQQTQKASDPNHQQQNVQQPQFWRLDENERHFRYCDSHSSASSTSLDTGAQQHKLAVAHIHRIVHGSEYSSKMAQQLGGTKVVKKGGQSAFRFGLCLELSNAGGGEEFHLGATDESELAAWLEGLNCLCFPDIALQTPTIRDEVDRLLQVEIRVRILDVPVDALHKDPLPVPELPTDLSWIPASFIEQAKPGTRTLQKPVKMRRYPQRTIGE